MIPDGSPQVTPVWVDTDGEAVLFNTSTARVKYLGADSYPFRKDTEKRVIIRVLPE